MRKTGMIALALLAGCVSTPGIRPLRPLEIPTAPYQEFVTSSLIGSLSYEGGCLLFYGANFLDRWRRTRICNRCPWPVDLPRRCGLTVPCRVGL